MVKPKDDWRCSECGGVWHGLTACPERHWISCVKFTVEVEVNSQGVITRAAPVARRFVGQQLLNLLQWAEKLGGMRHEVLS